MSAKHTPGPWKLTRNPSRIEVRTDATGSYAFSLRDEANARLIAAAPDFYAAAELDVEAFAHILDIVRAIRAGETNLESALDIISDLASSPAAPLPLTRARGDE